MNLVDVVDLHQRTADFCAKMNPPIGWRFLYGPAFEAPPVLWVGFQPGGDCVEPGDNVIQLSGVCEYAYKDWTLVRRMQDLFPLPFLESCVATNLIPVRAKSVKKYKDAYSREARKEILEFGFSILADLIDRLKPRRVIAIGVKTLKLTDPIVELKGAREKRIIRGFLAEDQKTRGGSSCSS